MPTSDPSALVITFGKYRGATVAELLERDPAYAQWLLGQGWLAERFAELHAAILTRGSAPDDSPEHNRIQVRFLDPLFRAALISLTQDVAAARSQDWNDRAGDLKDAVYKHQRQVSNIQKTIERNQQKLADERQSGWHEYTRRELVGAEQQLPVAQANLAAAQAELDVFPHLPLLSAVSFEQSGVDVLVRWGFLEDLPDHGHRYQRTVAVEIKPTIGDDYPSVMRQMQRLHCPFLLIENYTGTAVPLPLLRNMFKANRCMLITIADAEAAIPNARQLL